MEAALVAKGFPYSSFTSSEPNIFLQNLHLALLGLLYLVATVEVGTKEIQSLFKQYMDNRTINILINREEKEVAEAFKAFNHRAIALAIELNRWRNGHIEGSTGDVLYSEVAEQIIEWSKKGIGLRDGVNRWGLDTSQQWPSLQRIRLHRALTTKVKSKTQMILTLWLNAEQIRTRVHCILIDTTNGIYHEQLSQLIVHQYEESGKEIVQKWTKILNDGPKVRRTDASAPLSSEARDLIAEEYIGEATFISLPTLQISL